MKEKREQLLQVIYDHCLLGSNKRNPNIILNDNNFFYDKTILFSSRDAVELILECEKFLEVPNSFLRKKFPLRIYFSSGFSETFLSSPSPIMEFTLRTLVILLLPILIPCMIFFGFIYSFEKNMYRFFNIKIEIACYIMGFVIDKMFRMHLFKEKPLTAIKFANIIIDLWQEYQEEQNSLVG